MNIKQLLLLAAAAGVCLHGQPALHIDAAANQHAISPDIYGINWYWDTTAATEAAAADIRATARRWGGNNTSTYHWKLDVWNIDADWFYEVLPDTSIDASKLPEGSSFNAFVDRARTTGGKVVGTIPVLGWLPKARREMCSFDVSKYGNQCKVDPYAKYHPMTCGNGIAYVSACGDPAVNDGKAPSNPTYIKNDPADAYQQADETLQKQWVAYAVSRYGKGAQGGVTIWSLDNEPIWWDSTHRDIHPDPYTYDELLRLNIGYAEAVKQADPTAMVAGPVSDNWSSLWLSKKDITAGWAKGNYWSNPVDRNAHGGVALMPWYLQQMRNYEKQNGCRLLDYMDLHAYILPSSLGGSNMTAAQKALQLDSTREFWDPSYIVNGDYWIKDIDNNGAPVAPRLIPRLREMVSANYPGTKIAITEYDWAAQDTLNGALAQADLLGIFGRENLDLATLWATVKPTDPAAFAFKMYRNYDGIGGAFGETSVQASSGDQGKLAIYAALRADRNLTAVVINKTGADVATPLALSNFDAGAVAKVWRYGGAKLDAIVAASDIAINGNAVAATYPANTITMLVIPPATLPVAKPVVKAVTNAASYDTAIAPGQMVVVWGTNLGPAQPAGLTVDSNGMVATRAGDVRILFDGVPAPAIYASATQTSAVAPYFGTTKSATHIVVEVQGVASDAVEIPVSATAPGLFTANYTGTGQGAILNRDGTPNSASAGARAGEVVVLWGTGEGVTNPPGVDGRPAVEVMPKPVAAVTVEIGGVQAAVEYAGAAPYTIPGLFQINARVPASLGANAKTPVKVKIGNKSSQDGVTLAVR